MTNQQKPKYKVFDMYEGADKLGYCNNITSVKKMAREQYNDTDGECSVYYALLKENGKYDVKNLQHVMF